MRQLPFYSHRTSTIGTIWITKKPFGSLAAKAFWSRNRQALKGYIQLHRCWHRQGTDGYRPRAHRSLRARSASRCGYQLRRHLPRSYRPVQPHPCLRSQRPWRSQRCTCRKQVGALRCRSQQTTCSPYAWRNLPTNSTRPTPKRPTENQSVQAK